MIEGAFTAVALAALAVSLVMCLVCFRLLSRERRENARAEQRWETERARLIDQMCNLADKPWSPPPARSPERAAEPLPEQSEDDTLAVW